MWRYLILYRDRLESGICRLNFPGNSVHKELVSLGQHVYGCRRFSRTKGVSRGVGEVGWLWHYRPCGTGCKAVDKLYKRPFPVEGRPVQCAVIATSLYRPPVVGLTPIPCGAAPNARKNLVYRFRVVCSCTVAYSCTLVYSCKGMYSCAVA